MSGDITKGELMAMIEVQEKSTQQMVLIAERLKEILKEQKEANLFIKDGLADLICKNVQTTMHIYHESCVEDASRIESKLDTVKNGMFWLQLVVGGSVGLGAIVFGVAKILHWLTAIGA